VFVEVDPPAAPTGPVVRAARPARARRLLAAAPPYLYLLPAVAGLVVWVYWPLVGTVQLSFYDWNLLPTAVAEPVGTSNYAEALQLPELGRAAVNTLVYVVGLLPFTVVLPVLVALAVQRIGGRWRSVHQAAIFAPFLVAPVAAAILWRWLLAPDGGLVNRTLGVAGVDPVNWLREPGPALVAILLIAGWKVLGFAVLIVSAGLSQVDGSYAEAAEVDGASRWQVVRHITLPLLSPTLVFLAVFTVLVGAQLVFPLVDALTRGGPGDATTNLYYLLYEKAFSGFDAGVASAAALLFFVVFAVLATGALRLLDRWSFHDA
jgi:multiple sugar transport system permease protein